LNIALDLLEFGIFFVILTLLVKPLGKYMSKVYTGKRIFLSPLISPVEKWIYRLTGVDADHEMNWKEYAFSMLLFNFIGFIALFLILIFQGLLPLNPEHFNGFSLSLALNTAVSFVTNTNWQAYSGESMASYFTQMAGLAVQNFLSAATGMAILVALMRGISRKNAKAIGNFWVDLTRSTLYILLPLSIIAAVFFLSQGVIQNFDSYKVVDFLQPVVTQSGTVTHQVLPMGPVASQEAIKLLGTNGGGFFGANSAHPYENPNPLTNFIEVLLISLIPASLTYTFGKMVGDTRQGWAIYIVMLSILLIFLGIQYYSQIRGDPLITNMGVSGPYMEGMEARFGVGGSVLFSTITTGTSEGAVNTSMDSLTPIGGMSSMVLILLSEVAFGGVGSGLYTMLAFVIIAVFIAGLMIGRTPEYMGKKIEVKEMWMAIITALTSGIVILIFTSIALITKNGTSAILNPGAHGLSEILYAFASTANNNGSAFAGLNANTLFYNLATGFAMLIGRYIPAIATLVMAGSLAGKKYTPPNVGTLPTHKPAFMVWLFAVIIIVGALTFFAALSMGPVVENLIMWGGI
jgi:K+-transporting ATPase ATPase A chain